MYYPQQLRFPITLCKIKLSKNKQPSEDLENPYESNICPGKFVGAYETHNCRGSSINESKELGNFPIFTEFN